MSVRFRPFEAGDVWKIDVQARHQWVLDIARTRPFALGALEANPWSFTAHEGDEVLCCAGAVDGEMWCFLAEDLGRRMVPITRYGRSLMALHPGELWASIDPDHPEAVRWARIGGLRQVDQWLWIRDARPA